MLTRAVSGLYGGRRNGSFAGKAALTLEQRVALLEANMATAAEIVAAMEASKIGKYLLNKKITDPATGIMTVYEADDTTPAFSAAVKKDAAGTIPYNGTGAERIERMT